MVEKFMAVLGAASQMTGIHSWFTGLQTGDQMKKILHEVNLQRVAVQKISDKIIHIPTLKQVQTFSSKTDEISSGRELRQILDPVQQSIGGDMLSTAVLETPEKLQKSFKDDPWKLLLEIRPASRARRPQNPDLVPISFVDEGITWIGWQTKSVLPFMFDCDFNQKIVTPDSQYNPKYPDTPKGRLMGLSSGYWLLMLNDVKWMLIEIRVGEKFSINKLWKYNRDFVNADFNKWYYVEDQNKFVAWCDYNIWGRSGYEKMEVSFGNSTNELQFVYILGSLSEESRLLEDIVPRTTFEFQGWKVDKDDADREVSSKGQYLNF